MINIENKEKCCGCNACANICPKEAIIMVEDEKGFKYPVIDKEKCINCGLCEKICPIINNKQIETKPKAYAAINKDEEIRMQSSSGGIFSLISDYILEKNGVVFGATFDESFGVKHISIENKKDMYKLRTSKYLQSNIGNTYKKAKGYLEENRLVLFTGTPCQIEGFKSYLGKEYENLYTQDIICHGVPSARVWRKYQEYREEQDERKPENINFRDKCRGWHDFSLKFKYKDKEYSKTLKEDEFIRAFLSDVCLRDSCYNCSFKKYNRNSDITLADFWGIENIKPKMDDNKGTSLVITNSIKGQQLLENIREKCIIEEVDLNEAIKYNRAFNNSVSYNKNREKFFNELDKKDFSVLVKKYAHKKSKIKRILHKLKQTIKKLIKK